jgi:catechol-2,3-dioxygenase
MKIRALGHVVVRVSDRAKAEAFYNGVLGLPIVARFEDGPKMTFFSLGNHHDFAVMEDGEAVGAPGLSGLHHVAFKIGDSLDDLRGAKAVLEANGLELRPVDHEVTKSLYTFDPDGNGVELYIDASDVWKREPQRVAQMTPLAL